MSNLRNDSPVRPIFVHAHVPKTGGTSLNQLLCTWFEGRMKWMEFADPMRMFTQEEMEDCVSKNPHLDCITSHHFRVFPPVIAGRPALYLTFLRETGGYFISLAKHFIRERSNLSAEFLTHLPKDYDKQGVSALLDFWIDGARQRKEPHHLFGAEMCLMFFEGLVHHIGFAEDKIATPKPDENWARYLAKAIAINQLNQFFFVGDFETYAEDVRGLARTLKTFGAAVDKFEVPWERRATEPPFALPEREEEIRNTLLMLFPVDQEVYEHFHQRRLSSRLRLLQ